MNDRNAKVIDQVVAGLGDEAISATLELRHADALAGVDQAKRAIAHHHATVAFRDPDYRPQLRDLEAELRAAQSEVTWTERELQRRNGW